MEGGVSAKASKQVRRQEFPGMGRQRGTKAGTVAANRPERMDCILRPKGCEGF